MNFDALNRKDIDKLQKSAKLALYAFGLSLLAACGAKENPSATPSLTPTISPENATAVILALQEENANLQGTIAAQDGVILEFATPTGTATATLLPTSTETPVPTFTATAFPTENPVYSGTPDATATLFGEGQPPEDNSEFHITSENQNLVVVEDGIARLNMPIFRDYFATALDAQGLDSEGNIVDFTANMLAGSLNDRPMPLNRNLNWWIEQSRGLGWTSADPVYESISEMSAVSLPEIMEERDGIFRFAVQIETQNFEQGVAVASVMRYLAGANMLESTPEEIQAFLVEHNDEIKNLWETLIANSGYRPLPDTTVTPWPGAEVIFTEFRGGAMGPQWEHNLLSNEGDVCVAPMAGAQTRDDQRETTVNTEYRIGTEAIDPIENNENRVDRDSTSRVLLVVTFDNNQPALSDGALSPNEFGVMRVDEITINDIEDTLSPERTTPVEDTVVAVSSSDFSRWVACGNGRGEIIVTQAPYSTAETTNPNPEATPTPWIVITPEPSPTTVYQNDPTSAPTGTDIPVGVTAVATLVPATIAPPDATEQVPTPVIGASPTPGF